MLWFPDNAMERDCLASLSHGMVHCFMGMVQTASSGWLAMFYLESSKYFFGWFIYFFYFFIWIVHCLMGIVYCYIAVFQPLIWICSLSYS